MSRKDRSKRKNTAVSFEEWLASVRKSGKLQAKNEKKLQAVIEKMRRKYER